VRRERKLDANSTALFRFPTRFTEVSLAVFFQSTSACTKSAHRLHPNVAIDTLTQYQLDERMEPMFKGAQHLHILIWWIILVSGLWAVVRVWRGQLAGAAWTKMDKIAGLVFSSALATQFLVGTLLYSTDDVVRQFLHGGAAGPDRLTSTFFGVLHPLAMFTAVILGQVGYSFSKRLGTDTAKFRVAALCYTAALAIVLIAVPWPGLPYGHSLVP
jgi:hypothetical protein